MSFTPKAKYKEEAEFRSHIAKWLDSTTWKSTTGIKSRIDSEEEKKKDDNNRPDITITPEKNIELEYRTLSSPTYIECKIGSAFIEGRGKTPRNRIPVQENLMQLLRYKYKKQSKKHIKLGKYGDYHIAVTAPYFFTKKWDPYAFNEGYPNIPQTIRTLWHLGIGILHKKRGETRISFNEQEEVVILD